jgi:hypothetical protein
VRYKGLREAVAVGGEKKPQISARKVNMIDGCNPELVANYDSVD